MHNFELDFSLNIKDLSKIEGSVSLEVKVQKRKVVDTRLIIDENKRFFLEAIIGKSAFAIPQIVSRICGTCSVAHILTAVEAIETAFSIEPSKQTVDMRKLLMNGTHIRDHAMHLYFFALPDYLGKDSVLDFDKNQHKLIHKALEIKSAGNKLGTLIGGRAIHSPFPVPGGFLKFPQKKQIKEVILNLKKIRESALDLIDIFYEANFKFESPGYYIGLVNDDYNYITGEICSDEGKCVPEYAFGDYLDKVIIPYSQARGFTYQKIPYMVGAHARMNHNKECLHKKTKKDLRKYLKRFPSKNVFDNNLAQAIEIIHEIDASIELLEKIEIKKQPIKKGVIKKGVGVGVVAAPRGLLHYKILTDEKGKINYANLVTPTAQNQVKMEKDLGLLVQEKLDQGIKKEKIILEMEKLIRAYDPCMSCATNFLKVNWL